MAQQPLPPPPPGEVGGPAWIRWFNLVLNRLTQAAQLAWTQVDFTASNLTSIVTRNHNDLQNIQGGAAGDYQHLTTAQVALIGTVAMVSNVMPSPTAIATDKSYVVISYLSLNSDLTLNGNLMVTG